jgi:hypothetical protein
MISKNTSTIYLPSAYHVSTFVSTMFLPHYFLYILIYIYYLYFNLYILFKKIYIFILKNINIYILIFKKIYI